MAARTEIKSPLDRIRAICMARPDVQERLSKGEPTWVCKGKRSFLIYTHDFEGRVAFWCAAPPGVQEERYEEDPYLYFSPPELGHRGWVGMYLDGKVDWDAVEEIVENAYITIATKR